jgi:cyclopropane-fatty-acyl-phospholipid synthase
VNELESDPLAFATATVQEAVETSAPPRASLTDRACRALIFRAFAPMRRGRLTLRLPDGSLREFGTGEDGPLAEVSVRSSHFFRRCVVDGDIGFGESYQAGEWDSPDLCAVIAWFCANVEQAPTLSGSQNRGWFAALGGLANRLRHALNRNSLAGSKANIHAHYDLGNAFYSLWLDPTMTYSAALFEFPDQDLAAAQTAKYDRLCRELRLRPTDHVLEIGSGWGGFTEHAVRNYGCRVTTVTISEEQRKFAGERFARAGIADRAEVKLQDYRLLTGQFDKIVSIEMLEAVGDQYLEAYFGKVQSLLTPHGLFAAQFITYPDSRYARLRDGVDWIQKHIFPGSLLLSLNRVGQAIQKTGSLSLHNLHDLGLDYAQTLRLWRGRFNGQLDAVRALGFDERFIRTWNYYLAYCEAAFAWRNISVVQATWTGPNNRSLM